MEDRIFELIAKEEKRQEETLMLIPSENYTYPEVRQAVGSVLMHKYAEGYPGRRYYRGCQVVDEIENLAIERAKKLFGVPHANVQPYSGSIANAAVYFALLNANQGSGERSEPGSYFTLLKPGEKIMGMTLSSGGHLTHGHPKITFSGKYFQSVQYSVGKDGWLDYDLIETLAVKEKPKLIICGFTAYPRIIDFKRFGKIAQKVGAWLLADISHIAGLVLGGVHSSPVSFADVVTTTTHKTLRGPRGAIIMATDKGLKKDPDLAKKLDRAVFPGLQGGPHMNNIAGIAICLEKARQLEFKEYARQVVANAKALAENLLMTGFNLVTGGTDNHLILVDLRNSGIEGKTAAERLEKEGIIVNENLLPEDEGSARKPSGIRLGTPAATARGMGQQEMKKIGEMIKEVLVDRTQVRKKVIKLCRQFPLR